MKKKMTLNNYGYDCCHLFIHFPFFELLGKFTRFIMKRKNATISILETELTGTLANDDFDDLYGAALNLPMCHRVKKGEKALFFKLSFLMSCSEEVAFYDGLRQRLIFFGHFFVNILTVIVRWHLCLPFNKCVTPERLALSRRGKKML